jgi:hypothetical protein
MAGTRQRERERMRERESSERKKDREYDNRRWGKSDLQMELD